MFDRALQSWGSEDFPRLFKDAVKSTQLEDLPLGSCCNHSAVIDQTTLEPIILSSKETLSSIEVKMGVLFCEILSGCACSDDPSQAKILDNSYCEIIAIIDKKSAETKFINA